MKRNGTAALVLVLLLMVVRVVVFNNNRTVEDEIMDDMPPMANPLDPITLGLIEDIASMEGLISDYYSITETEVINNAVMAFIRSERYGYRAEGMSRSIWMTYAGNLKEEAGIDLSIEPARIKEILRFTEGMELIIDPISGSDIDFIHLIAVVDVHYTDMPEPDYMETYMDYFLSWGGDFDTFLTELGDYSDSTGTNDYDCLYQHATEILGEESDYFSSSDYLADLDGVNIERLMDTQAMLLSEALMSYYGEGLFSERERQFLDANGGDEGFASKARAYVFGEVPEEYSTDREFQDYLEDIQSFKYFAMQMMFVEGYEPSDLVKEAALAALIKKVEDE